MNDNKLDITLKILRELLDIMQETPNDQTYIERQKKKQETAETAEAGEIIYARYKYGKDISKRGKAGEEP